MSLKSLIEGTRLEDVVERKGDVAALFHDTPIGDGLKTLCERKILSCPVVVRHASAKGLETPQATGRIPVLSLLGFVGVSDVLSEFLKGDKFMHALQLKWSCVLGVGSSGIMILGCAAIQRFIIRANRRPKKILHEPLVVY